MMSNYFEIATDSSGVETPREIYSALKHFAFGTNIFLVCGFDPGGVASELW